jgi:4-amino-4-deoxy-L-arabinose transferase-like glycosyltransferase
MIPYILILLAVAMIGYILAWDLTEGNHILSNKYQFFSVKPFSCRPCLTFWITSLFHYITGVMIQSERYIVAGIAVALLTFVYLYIKDRKHIQ